MARMRGTARDAPRHSGEQYGSGFQYRYPEEFDVKLGPWSRISPRSERNEGKEVLRSIANGFLRDGFIAPLFADTATTNAIYSAKNCWPISSYVFNIGGVDYELVFLRNATDGQLAILNNGVFTSFAAVAQPAAAMDIMDPPIHAVQWGQYVYFGGPGISGGLCRYTPATATLSVIGGNAIYDLFVLHNNLCKVEFASSIFTMIWSVDGTPENFTGSGSGSYIFTRAYRKAALYNEAAYLLFSDGALRMDPTGTLPSFSFTEVPEITGCGDFHTNGSDNLWGTSVVSNKRCFVYIDGSRRLKAFTSSGVIDLSEDMPHLAVGEFGGVWCFSLPGMNWIGVAANNPLDLAVFWFDKDLKLVMTEGTAAGETGTHPLVGISVIDGNLRYHFRGGNSTTSGTHVTRELSPLTQEFGIAPDIRTGYIDAGEEVLLEYIEIETPIAGTTSELRPVIDSGRWIGVDVDTGYSFNLVDGLLVIDDADDSSTIGRDVTNKYVTHIEEFPAVGAPNLTVRYIHDRVNNGVPELVEISGSSALRLGLLFRYFLHRTVRALEIEFNGGTYRAEACVSSIRLHGTKQRTT